MEAVSVSVASKKLPLLVTYDLPASAEKAFHELCVSLREKSGHQNIDRMADNLVLAVPEDFRETLTGVHDFTD